METDEISGIEHFLVIKMEQHENSQTTESPDVQMKTCKSSPMQDCKNKRQYLTELQEDSVPSHHEEYP
ncbi:hypothetical protein Q8A67_005178 [Cirrhinus molitorella]|uniref:Uncharacterized protein n=1 Tax=Cirrhinus molitorella TaxID=172907 RepID=A0AA88Q9G2_9TELE|nr:hypothetical protein Q8A67_005178 [Cirrhinus molitorella]